MAAPSLAERQRIESLLPTLDENDIREAIKAARKTPPAHSTLVEMQRELNVVLFHARKGRVWKRWLAHGAAGESARELKLLATTVDDLVDRLCAPGVRQDLKAMLLFEANAQKINADDRKWQRSIEGVKLIQTLLGHAHRRATGRIRSNQVRARHTAPTDARDLYCDLFGIWGRFVAKPVPASRRPPVRVAPPPGATVRTIRMGKPDGGRTYTERAGNSGAYLAFFLTLFTRLQAKTPEEVRVAFPDLEELLPLSHGAVRHAFRARGGKRR